MKIGVALAFFLGIFYFLFLAIMGMELESNWGWVIIAVILPACVVTVLNNFFPPKSLWIYPGTFSLATLLVGILSLISGDQPTIVVGTWFSIAVAINIVGYFVGYIVQSVCNSRKH
jgi:hypothetical protein